MACYQPKPCGTPWPPGRYTRGVLMFQTQNFSIGAVATWQSKLIRFQGAVPSEAVSLNVPLPKQGSHVGGASFSLFSCGESREPLSVVSFAQQRDVAWVLKMDCVDCNVQHPFHQTQIVQLCPLALIMSFWRCTIY